MMFIILDECPVTAVHKLPEKIRFKQLIELGQLICSAGISNVYKKIPQGKRLQAWITLHPYYTYRYFRYLLIWCQNHINLSEDTDKKLSLIALDLAYHLEGNPRVVDNPHTAIFRYAKEYKSVYPTDSELTIENAIKAYEEYMEWKNYDKK